MTEPVATRAVQSPPFQLANCACQSVPSMGRLRGRSRRMLKRMK